MGQVTVRSVEDGCKTWAMCPACRRGKLIRVDGEARASGVPIFCRICKRESLLDIEKNARFPNGVRVSLSDEKGRAGVHAKEAENSAI